MKTPKNKNLLKFSSIKRTSLLGCLTLLGLGATLVHAGNDTWVGNSSANWGDSNWTGANNPPVAGDALFFGTAGSAGSTLNNNFTSGTSFGGLTFNPGASAFTLGGNAIATTAAVTDNSLNLETITLSFALAAASHSVNVASGGSLLIGGVISDGGSGYGITKTGAGLLTLTNASTYTGATTVSSGTLTLDFNDGGQTANIISATSPLALTGGTLNINGGTSVFSSQTFASLTASSGFSVVSAAPASGVNYPNLTLGAVTASVGGVVEFVGPAYSNDTNDPAQTTVTGVATNNTTTAAGTGGFGGNGTTTGDFATVGLYDWASTVADPVSGNDIVGGSQVSGFYTAFGTGNNTLAGNVDFTGPTAGSHNTDNMTSIRFNQLSGCIWSPGSVVTTGGILVTPNNGTNNVYIEGTAGELEPSRGGASATVVWQNDIQDYLIFNVNNFFNNAKSGAGTLIFAGPGTVQTLFPSTYTGPTFVNGNSVLLAGNDLGAVGTASTNFLNGGTLVANATFALDNAGATPRLIGLLNNGGGLAAAAGKTLTVDGTVSGTTPLTIGIPASTNNSNVVGLVVGSSSGTNIPVYATGTVALTGVNTASGGTFLVSGTLQVGTTAALPTGGVTFNGGNFQWTGTSPDISAQTVTINAPATLDVNGHAVTLAGSIGNGGSGSVTVANSGSPGTGGLFLNGGISYTGGTTVASGAVLGGSGTVAGNVTWSSGSYAALSATSLLTVSGAVNLHNPIVQVIGSGLTTGVYTLLTATGGIVSGSAVNSSPAGGAVANGYAGVVSISGNSVILTVTQLGVAATWTDALGDQNWSEAGNWTGGFAPSNPGDAATFGTGGVGAPVILNQNETVGGLTFNNASSYTINGSSTLALDNKGNAIGLIASAGTANAINTPVTLNGNLTATISAGDAVTFGNTVANKSSAEILTVTGGGTAVLSAANSYGPAAGTVGTTLSGSTVQVGNNSALGTGDVSVTGASTLKAGAASVTLANNVSIANLGTLSVAGNNLTLGGVITGNGAISAGSAGLNLTGANNTYAGGTALNGGIVTIDADGAAAGNAGSLGVVPATTALNNIVFNGGDLLASTTLTLNANRGLGIGATSGLNTATTTALLDAARGQTFTVAGVIASAGNSGENNLTVNSETGSTGTVVLGGADTFNGTNIIAAGEEQLGNALALQNSTLFYNGQGGLLDFGTQTAATFGALLGAENLTLTNDAAGPVALTLGNNNGTSLYTGILGDAGTGASLTINGTGTQQIGSGSVGGATYTGGTTIVGGTLILGGYTSLTGPLSLPSSVNSLACSLTVQDSAVIVDTATLYVASSAGAAYPGVGTVTLLGNANVTAPAFSFGDSSRVPAGCFLTVSGNSFINVTGGFELEYAEGSTAQNNVVNLNSGTLSVSNFTLTYYGATHQATINFNGGVLAANASDSSGSLYLPALNNLTVNITNATAPAYVNSSNYWITIAAPLTDSGSGDAGLVKQGPGTLVLSGANTYTGPTTVSNGTLLVSGLLNNTSENFFVNDGQGFGSIYDGSDTAAIGSLTLGNQAGGTTLLFTNVSSTSSSLFTAEAVTLNGPSTIKIADAVNLTTPGEYPLLGYASIVTNSGPGFSLVLPAGLKATLTNDTSIPALAVNVISYTPPAPVFGPPVVSGNDLVLSASGGKSGDPVTVLGTTNLTLPLAQWTTVTTGVYDVNGNFTYTVSGALSSGNPQEFYLIQGQ